MTFLNLLQCFPFSLVLLLCGRGVVLKTLIIGVGYEKKQYRAKGEEISSNG